MARYDRDKQLNDTSNMNRQQLLEILIEQSKEADNLKKENVALKRELWNVQKRAKEYQTDLENAFACLRAVIRLDEAANSLDITNG
ncbi:MAG: hypothetical protein IJV59_06275 [Eubacterium sp.]|nr:hypothetical protein [Eubacterium sp.]MBQ9022633.1 hypothetical protein [Eubacterium sp.]